MEYHSQQLMEDGKGRISTKDMILDWGAIGFDIGNIIRYDAEQMDSYMRRSRRG